MVKSHSNLFPRRHCLKAAGLSVALPMLESLASPTGAKADDKPVNGVKRFVTVGTYLGFHTPSWFPKQTGRDYRPSTVLKPIDDLRDQFTVFSGLDHRAPNGHKNWKNYLTGKATPGISVDQIVSGSIGDSTRFESLQLSCGLPGGGQMSFTKEGIALPAIGRPRVLFGKLFHSGDDKKRMGYLLDSGGSVLDLVMDEAKTLRGQVSGRDAAKLSEYFSSVRDVERKLKKQREWLSVPTPKVQFDLPVFDPIAPDLSLECESIMYDLMSLALETDSTRVISLLVPGQGQVFTLNGEKLSAGYHGLSHHGNDPEKVAEFNRVGQEHVSRFGDFVRQLQTKKDANGQSLLDSTAILYGSGMGDANTHNNSRLPILLAGGPFKHGFHHAIDRDATSTPAPLLGDLFLTIMQSMGIQANRFANAKRNLNELLL